MHYTITYFELIPMFQAHTEDTHRLHAAPQSVQIAAGRRRTVRPDGAGHLKPANLPSHRQSASVSAGSGEKKESFVRLPSRHRRFSAAAATGAARPHIRTPRPLDGAADTLLKLNKMPTCQMWGWR
jgi:hypothetical protein